MVQDHREGPMAASWLIIFGLDMTNSHQDCPIAQICQVSWKWPKNNWSNIKKQIFYIFENCKKSSRQKLRKTILQIVSGGFMLFLKDKENLFFLC